MAVERGTLVSQILDPAVKLSAIPRNLEWGSLSHSLSFTGARMRATGKRLVDADLPVVTRYFNFAPWLHYEASPEAIAASVAITAALTNGSYECRHEDTAPMQALLRDVVPRGEKALERFLHEVCNVALEHHDNFRIPQGITLLSFLYGLETMAREGSWELPAFTEAMDEALSQRSMGGGGKMPFLPSNAPYTKLVTREYHHNYMGKFYSLEHLLRPGETLLEFHGRYWEVMNASYLSHLDLILSLVIDAFRTGDIKLMAPTLDGRSFMEQVGEMTWTDLKAWGVEENTNRRKLGAARERPVALAELVRAMRESESFLGPHLNRVSVESLTALLAAVEEYNLEWALASFDWDEHPRVPVAELLSAEEMKRILNVADE